MSDLEPITREDIAWAEGNLEPVTRKEQYLNRLTGEEQDIPDEPITRTEQYLAKLCGEETEIPGNPITREETYLAYLNGEDVTLPEPITRLEQFMAYAAEKSETKPTPLTREEFYWNKYQGGAVLKDFPGLPASIVTVTDALAKPLDSLKVAITPVQSGSGDPSPDNIRPISGWDEANITVDPNVTPILPVLESAEYYSKYFNVSTFTAKPNSEYYVRSNAPYLGNNATTFIVCAYEDTPSTVAYGVFGTELRITTKTSGKISVYWRSESGGSAITITNIDDFKDGTYYLQITDHPTDGYMGEKYQITFTDGTDPLTVYGGTLDVVNGTLTVTKANIASYDGETLPGVWISDRDVYAEGTTPTTGAQVVYDLDTPITYHLTPTEIQMLLGTNNIWANTGDILEGKYYAKR